MPRLTITEPGTLLPVIVDREITDGLAKAIVEMIRADDIVDDEAPVIDSDGYCWACASYGNVHDPEMHGLKPFTEEPA